MLVTQQPGAVLQASANVNQGGYNWSSDPNFDFVMTVGAWNQGVNGNFMGTEDYLKSEIDLYADGYVSNLFGYSGFGTSFSTPAVAAETLNYLYEQTKGQSFSSASDHREYLFDIISPGSTSLDTWADNLINSITSEVKITFTDGSSEIVKVLTSDLDEGLLEPSTVPYYGESNYWGAGKVPQRYELWEANVDPVIISQPSTTTNEDSQYNYQIEVTDPNLGDSFVFSATNLPNWLQLDPNSGLLSGTPSNDDVGNHEIELFVYDDAGGSDAQIFELNVENVNDPPVFVPTLTWNMGWQEISELSYAMTYEHFKDGNLIEHQFSINDDDILHGNESFVFEPTQIPRFLNYLVRFPIWKTIALRFGVTHHYRNSH